jgi:molybdopterin-binding protein
LLEVIAGVTKADKGRILLDGEDITETAIHLRNSAMVFQSSTLFPHLSVYDNIAYPLSCRKLKRSKIKSEVARLSNEFEIKHLLSRRSDTLSGGESQRVSLVRTLAAEPKCLLLDEPLSSLDVKSRSQIRSTLHKIAAMKLMPIVHVTHDYIEAASLATHIAVMENGRIVQSGTAADIFQHPRSEFIAKFVGIKNFYRGKLSLSSGTEDKGKIFSTDGQDFIVLTESKSPDGSLLVRSEDITIADTPSQTSARNCFSGFVREVTRCGLGYEVIVDIGKDASLEIAATVTDKSVAKLGLEVDKNVWVSFKASAVKFIED